MKSSNRIYYLSERNPDGTTAGNKARNDVENILQKRKYIPISALQLGLERKHGNRIAFKLKALLFINKIKNNIPLNSTIVIQYPMMAQFTNSNNKIDYSSIFSKLSKFYKLIAIVHDINDLREERVNHSNLDDLKLAYAIISHNKNMTDYLIKSGINSNRIFNLEIFDYLSSYQNKDSHFDDEATSCFAGNLNKSRFIYTIPDNIRDLGINLYGNGYELKKDKSPYLNYQGTYSSEKISSIIKGKYGLIWDGEKSNTCTGLVGNYLKYNNPHKLSMYLVANIPIIIWDQAAEAQFVKKNNVGITISSIDEIPNKLSSIDAKKYDKMLDSVKLIKNKLLQGKYLNTQLDNIESKIINKKNENK